LTMKLALLASAISALTLAADVHKGKCIDYPDMNGGSFTGDYEAFFSRGKACSQYGHCGFGGYYPNHVKVVPMQTCWTICTHTHGGGGGSSPPDDQADAEAGANPGAKQDDTRGDYGQQCHEECTTVYETLVKGAPQTGYYKRPPYPQVEKGELTLDVLSIPSYSKNKLFAVVAKFRQYHDNDYPEDHHGHSRRLAAAARKPGPYHTPEYLICKWLDYNRIKAKCTSTTSNLVMELNVKQSKACYVKGLQAHFIVANDVNYNGGVAGAGGAMVKRQTYASSKDSWPTSYHQPMPGYGGIGGLVGGGKP